MSERWTAETEDRWAFAALNLIAELNEDEAITEAEWNDPNPHEREARAEAVEMLRPLLAWLADAGLLVSPELLALREAAKRYAANWHALRRFFGEDGAEDRLGDLMAEERSSHAALIAAVDALGGETP